MRVSAVRVGLGVAGVAVVGALSAAVAAEPTNAQRSEAVALAALDRSTQSSEPAPSTHGAAEPRTAPTARPEGAAPHAAAAHTVKLAYKVRFGDNWDTIAARHASTRAELRRWNPDVPRTFEAGTTLTVWVAPDFVPVPDSPLPLDRDAAGLPLMPVAAGGESAGQPSRGKLLHGVPLPDNAALYTIRRPEFAFGSTHAVLNLQLALAKFRQRSGYAGPLVVSDMSGPRGRSYGPHDSHQSGRDADLWLPLREALWRARELPRAELPDSFLPLVAGRADDIDWAASAQLVLSLIATGEVQYVFLSRPRQKHLYAALRARGYSLQELGELIQYPRRAQTAVIRHARRHDHHIHVRFRCASYEQRCL